jgi:hypothetical protein
MKPFFLVLFLSLVSLEAQSQVIWSEDFSYTDGTTVGTGSSWTGVCPACVTGDYFEVKNSQFEGSDVNDFATWETESIDISSCGAIDFSMDVNETGDHEGPGCACGINIDYFDLSYSIDGGAFVIIEDWNGDGVTGHTLTGDTQNGAFTDGDWVSTTISQLGLSGTSLVIRVELRNTAGSETMIIDNVVVSCSVVLPVTFESFEGEALLQTNELSWSTYSEQDNSHFEVQKSIDASSFSMIGMVEGKGTSTTLSNYKYEDRLVSGISYYRLKQVDFDGKSTYSKVISLSRSSLNQLPSPNPFTDHLFISLSTKATVSVQTVDGAVLQTQTLEKGSHDLQSLVHELPAGLLLLTVSSQETHEIYRVVKMN